MRTSPVECKQRTRASTKTRICLVGANDNNSLIINYRRSESREIYDEQILSRARKLYARAAICWFAISPQTQHLLSIYKVIITKCAISRLARYSVSTANDNFPAEITRRYISYTLHCVKESMSIHEFKNYAINSGKLNISVSL